MKRLLAIAALIGVVAVPTVAATPADAAPRGNLLCVWQAPLAGICIPNL